MITNYEQAKRLREIGSEIEKSLISIKGDGLKINIGNQHTTSVSDALQWIRDNKGIICGVYPIGTSYTYIVRLPDSSQPVIPYISEGNVWGNYPEAESALLDEVLDYLEGRTR